MLKEHRTPLSRYDRLVIFPKIASWQTSKGVVVPVYEDFNGWGTDYKLAGFWNVQTEQGIKVSEIRDEITPENRICTLEQAEVYIKAVESFIEEVKTTESARYNRPMYRTHDEENVRGRQTNDSIANSIGVMKCGVMKCSAFRLSKMLNYI